MASSIYDNEQYIFEIAQSFIRSRVIFTSMELSIFDLLLSHADRGLSCPDIAKSLNLHYVERESRCLQDVLDSLSAMHLLARDPHQLTYKLTPLAEHVLLPQRELLSAIDRQFYQRLPRLDESIELSTGKDSVYTLMLTRIQQLIDLTTYAKISIDSVDDHADAIVLWRPDGLLTKKLQQVFDALPTNGRGLLVLVVPNDEEDEVSLALNLLVNVTVGHREQENFKDFYSTKALKQLGFRTVERVKSSDGLELLLAYK